jgi:TRAP-type C4-dicarboxylate transport system permease large subunit
MTGLISGSSIANTVTTGTFTIPLMKRVGFSSEKAGAVEVSSSVNGQIMPPVMGAAAFLMVEYVGITYVEVITHAFLPAVISYIALFYIVHLEAMKNNMEGLPRRKQTTIVQSIFNFGITVASLIILSGIVYYGIGWMRDVFGPASPIMSSPSRCCRLCRRCSGSPHRFRNSNSTTRTARCSNCPRRGRLSCPGCTSSCRSSC